MLQFIAIASAVVLIVSSAWIGYIMVEFLESFFRGLGRK